MCMISLDVASVAQTKIFCGVNKEKTEQVIVYSNNVANKSTGNAMVLPVLNPESVKFYNLENNADFFKKCEYYFEDKCLTLGYTDNESRGFLEVKNVGSYKVSLAHNLDDIKRVDKTVFVLSDGLENMLSKYYPNDYGFIICKLDMSHKTYHPFAYSNSIDHKVFVPTRHYHHGQTENKMADDWDHDIYFYNVYASSNLALMEMCDYTEIPINIHLETIKFPDFPFPLDKCTKFSKCDISGRHYNMDFICDA